MEEYLGTLDTVLSAIRRSIAALAVGVVVAAAMPVGVAAQAVAILTVDRAQYTPGQTVVFTGAGWDACPYDIAVNLTGSDGVPVFIGVLTPVNGEFSGSFAAPPDLGSYVLDADGDAPGCVANTPFEVVQNVQTTTTASTTPTTPTAPTPTSVATTTTADVAPASATATTGPVAASADPLPATGSSPVLLVAGSLSLALGVVLVLVRRRLT
jgi:LPXTG-motif cell wall-anchored protein